LEGEGWGEREKEDNVTENGEHSQGPSHLAHHFSRPEQQFDSAKLGMWIFLATEVLFFGSLFCAYAVFRRLNPEIFEYGHQFLDTTLGGINTAILITSSFAMAWAVRCAQLGKRTGLLVLLALTMLGGCGFLGIKYVEYKHKWEEGLLPGHRFQPHMEGADDHESDESEEANVESVTGETVAAGDVEESATGEAARPATSAATKVGSAAGEDRTNLPPPGEAPGGLSRGELTRQREHPPRSAPEKARIFFGIYFTLTGLHGIHVLAGIFVIGWIFVRAWQGKYGREYYTPVDMVGLYWHLVDLVWIFLFPLLYLIH
jgi:cytochrome c oxidase subunit 3